MRDGRVLGEHAGCGLQVWHQRHVGDVPDDEMGAGLGGQLQYQRRVLRGEVRHGGHGCGRTGEVGDQRIVVAGPKKDRGRLGLHGEGGLAVVLTVAEAGKAEDELVDLLLSWCWIDERDRVGDVVYKRAWDGEVRWLRCEVVSACSGSCGGRDYWRRAYRDELQDVRGAGRGDQRQGDVEVRLRRDKGRPAVGLLRIQQRAALVSGGERVAKEDRGG